MLIFATFHLNISRSSVGSWVRRKSFTNEDLYVTSKWKRRRTNVLSWQPKAKWLQCFHDSAFAGNCGPETTLYNITFPVLLAHNSGSIASHCDKCQIYNHGQGTPLIPRQIVSPFFLEVRWKLRVTAISFSFLVSINKTKFVEDKAGKIVITNLRVRAPNSPSE